MLRQTFSAQVASVNIFLILLIMCHKICLTPFKLSFCCGFVTDGCCDGLNPLKDGAWPFADPSAMGFHMPAAVRSIFVLGSTVAVWVAHLHGSLGPPHLLFLLAPHASAWHQRHFRQQVLLRPPSRWSWQSRAVPWKWSKFTAAKQCALRQVLSPLVQHMGGVMGHNEPPAVEVDFLPALQ